ncbi:hypothetical protein BJ322DRAFT_1110359 [Thelephora terrestris]|uniref:Uncharacterized protein n=1 Tax=Thelephora terrestris TaxID=56493 RepID=A0A9P6L5T6_9AGAM|nr:hypothetical protein BJ322DRAFT_1110359 [Thelephora terrestris]
MATPMNNREGSIAVPPHPNPQTPALTATDSQNPASDYDHEMEIASEREEEIAQASGQPTRDTESTGTLPPKATAARPGPMNYAKALKRPAERSDNDEEDEDATQAEPGSQEGTVPKRKEKPGPGPIKGFSPSRVLENLDPQVRETWAEQAPKAVFVHYLNGGYTLNIAQNVHAITDDLTVIYAETFQGTEPIDPIVVHPTAAVPELRNQYGAPFVFLVTGIPEDFRKWLVAVGIHEVKSHLEVLFVENGEPIPHDYAVTLTNYNMRTETDVLRERAHERVRKSVTDTLFDKLSDTSRRTKSFVGLYRDNLDESLSNEEACCFVRDSVKVTSLDIYIPGVKIKATVYNVYIYPPTTDPKLLESWRPWIASQKYHADINGVGVKYKSPWNCNHCKAIDHPSGLCKTLEAIKSKAGGSNETLAAGEELLPLGPIPGSSKHPQSQPQGQRGATKDKGKRNPATAKGKAPGNPGKASARRTYRNKNRYSVLE